MHPFETAADNRKLAHADKARIARRIGLSFKTNDSDDVGCAGLYLLIVRCKTNPQIPFRFGVLGTVEGQIGGEITAELKSQVIFRKRAYLLVC